MNPKLQSIIKMNEFGSKRIPFIFLIDFDMETPIVIRAEEAAEHGIWYSFGPHSNCIFHDKPILSYKWTKHPLPFESYSQAFLKVQNELLLGNSYLLNLTFPTSIDTDLSLTDIFTSSHAPYRLLMKDKFVVFSPETFVKIHDGQISSCPMKGTIDASIPNAENALMHNPKEFSEHTTIVDLIRNDLSQVAKNVRVEKFRYIDRINTNDKPLLQMSSRIVGDVPNDYHCHLGTIFFTLLPAGSVTGAPKKKTVEIIKSIEGYDRGFYTGVAGYFNGHNLDSCVMIRFVEQTTHGMVYKSGGGITLFSTPEAEYQELIDKVYVPII